MRRWLRALLIGAVTLAIFAATLIVILRLFFQNHCDRFETVLATASDGKSVVYKYEACTAIGTTVDATVDLVTSKHRKTIFRFDPAYGIVSYHDIQVTAPLDPSAAWTSPNAVKISIGTVAAVSEERTKTDDVMVTYDIGRNLHMEQDLSK
jgi:hypothetical protein